MDIPNSVIPRLIFASLRWTFKNDLCLLLVLDVFTAQIVPSFLLPPHPLPSVFSLPFFWFWPLLQTIFTVAQKSWLFIDIIRQLACSFPSDQIVMRYHLLSLSPFISIHCYFLFKIGAFVLSFICDWSGAMRKVGVCLNGGYFEVWSILDTWSCQRLICRYTTCVIWSKYNSASTSSCLIPKSILWPTFSPLGHELRFAACVANNRKLPNYPLKYLPFRYRSELLCRS